MSGADGTPVKPASVYLPPLDAVVMQMLHFNLDAGRQLLLYGLDGDLIEINRFAMWVILDGDISTVGSRTIPEHRGNNREYGRPDASVLEP